MKLKKNIATSENGFIFNPSTGDSFSSNPIAAEILALMKAGQSAEDIKTEILGRYDVDRAQLERDWEDWVMQLRDANLIDL
ncbi:coenzyme PQQ synthesis protein D (PqqD) [Mucilaginibacter yixingensis]|uniref:Coenzyme PQQ synthesis protein D (PqqD) n=1 Tax=Mucilaginibacter yixingensis TaxID=1295612 RepID=A0A2T5JB27_9SPHI|nr:PqqD family protein [Mucilaginibacter yixingensis]PTQ98067.1 coenzyme PQQ synthesis protein D (PqqD) [Mucilaginibacter yixingensis]